MRQHRRARRPGWRGQTVGAGLVGLALCAVLPLVAGAVVVGTPVTAGATSGGSAVVPAANAPAPFSAHGSIFQAYVLGAKPGQKLVVVDAAGHRVGGGVADRFGSLIVRTLKAGPGYQVRAVVGHTVEGSKKFSVLSTDSPMPSSFYSHQHMHAGLNYITMRDGVQLAATVRLPSGATSLTQGPFPTLIEYSGYPIAAPGTLIKGVLTPNTTSITHTLLPTEATAVGSIVAPLLGFAVVSLQMRGSGCSGGAFDLFGLPTDEDGYDAVQTVGSQPWVAHHKVGLVGISFSGISQLFVGGTRPPDLAAIAPMSATNDLYTTGFPGGIFNDGFAAQWLSTREKEAEPATETGAQTWAKKEIALGTKQCLANQALHGQVMTIAAELAKGSHRTPALYDQRSPEEWAKHIDVPVFMVGALEDEETGPQWPRMIESLKGDKDVFVTMVNGTHVDSLGPGSITRWLEFLDIFVADKVPSEPAVVSALGSSLYQQIADATSEPLPAVRFTNAKNVTVARAEFIKDDPRVRVLFDNGGRATAPGEFGPEWTAGFTDWPPSVGKVTTFALGTGGALLSSASKKTSTVSYRPTPTARPSTDLPSKCTTPNQSSNVWSALPCYDWTPVTGTDGLGFVSPVLTKNVVVVGPASLNLELRSTAKDTDLQATVSEVYPTGKEMYVTSGFLRASDRALTASTSTALQPVPTFLAKTASNLPAGKFTLVRVPIDPIGFAFRKGSRIRVTIEAPGGTRPSWAFDSYKTGGKVVNTVELGGAHPSTLVMNVIPGVNPPDPQPACPSLRGEPCRTYVAAGNGG